MSQIMLGIYEDGAMRTASANAMELASQNHFELKCRGAATLEEDRTSAKQVLPCASRADTLRTWSVGWEWSPAGM